MPGHVASLRSLIEYTLLFKYEECLHSRKIHFIASKQKNVKFACSFIIITIIITIIIIKVRNLFLRLHLPRMFSVHMGKKNRSTGLLAAI